MLHPDDTFEFVFEVDRDKPEAERPVLVYRLRTVAHWRDYRRRYRELFAIEDVDKQLDAAIKLAGEGLLSARAPNNGQIPTPVDLEQLCTPYEIWELAGGLPFAADLSQDERKKAVLRSRSNGASSVPAAGPDIAPMPSATAIPPSCSVTTVEVEAAPTVVILDTGS